MRPEEIAKDYEKETGSVIIETFHERKIKALEVPAVLVKEHGPFTLGKMRRKLSIMQSFLKKLRRWLLQHHS